MTPEHRQGNIIRFPIAQETEEVINSDNLAWCPDEIAKQLGTEPLIAHGEDKSITQVSFLLQDAPLITETGEIFFPRLDVFPQEHFVSFQSGTGAGMYAFSEVSEIIAADDEVVVHAGGDMEERTMRITRDGIVQIGLLPTAQVRLLQQNADELDERVMIALQQQRMIFYGQVGYQSKKGDK